MKIVYAGLALIIIILAAALLPVRPYLDFQVIYHANLGLLRGITLYDHAGQVNMIAQLANVPPEQVFVLPFPYPPWYALSTLWLSLLPIDLAARAWFAVSLSMLLASAWLLTDGQSILKRLLLLLGALFWLPALGGLFVGQYGFPVLLGAALMIHALRRESPVLVALAAALLTFKPHLGGLVIILAVIRLARGKDRFGRNGLLALLAAAIVLFAAGFLASPNWPADYLHSLTGFRDVSRCGQCVSLPMAAAASAGGGFDQALWIAVVVAIVLGAWLVRNWRPLAAAPHGLVVAGILVTMLVSPYLQNYDYLLLLVPFLVLACSGGGSLHWSLLAIAFASPFAVLALGGSAGNLVLVFSALLLFMHARYKLFRPPAQRFAA